MPVMDGLETTRRIREMELKMDRPQTPIIALSAHVPPDYQAQCREAGCTDFLSKPIRKKELLSALWRCVLEGGHTLISSSYAIGAPEAETGKALVENVITVDEALRDVTVEFIRALRQQCHHLVNALKKKDFDTVLTVAKDMKEAGRGYDLEFVTEAGIDLGRLVQEKKPRAIFERTKKLYDFIKNASVEARRSKTGPGLGPEPIVVAVDEELAGVIDDYLQAVKRDVVAMGLAFSQNELEKVYLIAHDLKGSGSAYGLEKVTEIGGYICSLVRNNLRAPIAGQIEQLGAYINSVVVTSR
jgi:CheY-like chemotaxis protein